MSKSALNIGIRDATPTDNEVCFQIHRAAMGDMITQIWGWDEEDQHARHTSAFDPTRWLIITRDGEDIGTLLIHDRDGEGFLERIEIRPDHQGQGIGTRIIRLLLGYAEACGVDLVLYVFRINHRAHALYLRLGFHDETGPDVSEHHIRMRRHYPPLREGLMSKSCPDCGEILEDSWLNCIRCGWSVP